MSPPGPPVGVGVAPNPPPDQTTAELAAALVAALRATGYVVVGTRHGARHWGKPGRVGAVAVEREAAA